MSKYKGMTNYGVLTQDIKDYAEEVGKDSTEVWKMCIDKMVENGADEYEGYSSKCQKDYENYWSGWGYLFTNVEGKTSHFLLNFDNPIIAVKDLLGVSDDMTEKLCEVKAGVSNFTINMTPSTPLQLKLYGGEDVLEFMKDNPNIILDPVNMGESNETSRRLLGIRDGIVVVEIVVVEV